MKTRFLYLAATLVTATSCGSIKPLFNAKATNPMPKTGNHSPEPVNPITVSPSGQGSKRVYKDIQRSSRKTAGIMESRHPNLNYTGITENTHWLQFKYAIPIDVPVEALTNLAILQYIDNWYSVPYRYGGSEKTGIDCSAFTSGLLSSVFGVTIPRTAREQYQNSRRINKDDLQEGDLVFFNTTGGISHVGVYLINNKFVHAAATNGVTISDLNDEYYRRRYLGAGRASNTSAN